MGHQGAMEHILCEPLSCSRSISSLHRSKSLGGALFAHMRSHVQYLTFVTVLGLNSDTKVWLHKDQPLTIFTFLTATLGIFSLGTSVTATSAVPTLKGCTVGLRRSPLLWTFPDVSYDRDSQAKCSLFWALGTEILERGEQV